MTQKFLTYVSIQESLYLSIFDKYVLSSQKSHRQQTHNKQNI